MLEGPDLVHAALVADAHVEAVFVEARAWRLSSCAALLDLVVERGIETYDLKDGVLDRVADAATPQPVVAVAAMPDRGLDAVADLGFVVVCHGVRDPGNLGTVIRSADAAGAAAVVVSGDGVDVFNPKTLRATAGSIFQVTVAIEGDLARVCEALRGSARTVYAATAGEGTSMWDAALVDAAVVVGAEATGLTTEDRACCDAAVAIEMDGRAESLNVGVAASLLCFESLRQRRTGPAPSGGAPTI